MLLWLLLWVGLGLRSHIAWPLWGCPLNCLVATKALPSGHNWDCLPIAGCWLIRSL